MALGRQGERQTDLMVGWAELPGSPGHAFYDRLQAVLIEAGFDGFAETQCAPYYASRRGRPSLPPGRYFRMHLLGQPLLVLCSCVWRRPSWCPIIPG
jgi:transposase